MDGNSVYADTSHHHWCPQLILRYILVVNIEDTIELVYFYYIVSNIGAV